MPGPEPRTLFSPPPTAAELSHSERLASLRLIRSENVGPVTFRDLIAHFGSAGAALDAMPELSRRGGFRRAIRLCTLSEAESELERADRASAELLFMTEARYPTPLAALDAPPPLLYAKGRLGLLSRPSSSSLAQRLASDTAKAATTTTSSENTALRNIMFAAMLPPRLNRSMTAAYIGLLPLRSARISLRFCWT